MEIKNPKEVLQKSLEDSCGLTAYLKTLEVFNVDVSADENYQKNFTSYYRVRRDANWLKKYYEFMEAHKHDTNLTFETIIRYLSSVPHKVNKKVSPSGYATTIEASFASKMLATINPNYPIWDSQVVRALKYKIEAVEDEAKLEEYIDVYSKLTNEIHAFIETEEGKECIRLFDELFPNHKHLNSFKKIDFYLWNIGK